MVGHGHVSLLPAQEIYFSENKVALTGLLHRQITRRQTKPLKKVQYLNSVEWHVKGLNNVGDMKSITVI